MPPVPNLNSSMSSSSTVAVIAVSDQIAFQKRSSNHSALVFGTPRAINQDVEPSTSCEKSKSSIASSDHTSVENREAESPECKFAAVRYTNLALCIHYICI